MKSARHLLIYVLKIEEHVDLAVRYVVRANLSFLDRPLPLFDVLREAGLQSEKLIFHLPDGRHVFGEDVPY